jgi:hypothetical protein
MFFTPTKDFYSEGFRSQYCKDMVYRVRRGNDPLEAAVEEWRKSGLVKVIDVLPSEAGGLTNVVEPPPGILERIKSWMKP